MSQYIENAQNVAGRDVNNHFYTDLSESEKQAAFLKATGISCTEAVRVELEYLIGECGFTNEEIYMAWQAKLLFFDHSLEKLVVKSKIVSRCAMYVLFAIVAFLIVWAASEIMYEYKINKFPDNLIIISSSIGYGFLIYLLGRYGIRPLLLVRRLLEALDDKNKVLKNQK